MPYGKKSRGAASLWLEDEQGLPAIGVLPDAPEDTDLIGLTVDVRTDDNRNVATLTGIGKKFLSYLPYSDDIFGRMSEM